LEKQTVAIDLDTITAIYNKEKRISDSTKVINGDGKYLIPGLWDMHTHYNWNHTDSDPLLIANGITGVREMWGDMSLINYIRIKARSGKIIAPDIYTSGNIIDGYPAYWPGSVGVSTPEETKNVINKQIEEGVDFIKVYSRLTRECFMAIADIANQKNIPFAGHIPNKVSTYEAIEAGMASSEHFFGILIASSSKEDSIMNLNNRITNSRILLETFQEDKFDSLCIVLANSEMWLCPTLTVNRAVGYLNDPDFTKDERVAYLPDYIMSFWNPKNDIRFQSADDDFYLNLRKRFHFEQSLVGKMYERGVKFLAGTDYPNPYCFPGFSLHDELELLVEGGIPELEALKAATINGAVFMGRDDKIGTVEVGKLASLVLLNENPLADIKNIRSIETVLLRGKVFDRNELDNMLEQAIVDAAKIPYSEWIRSKILSAGIEMAMDSLDIMIEQNLELYKLDEFDINMLGYEYLNTGDIETAQAIFKKFIELFSESYIAYDSYAEFCMIGGKYEQAIKFYKKSLEINPGHDGAKIMIDSLRIIIKE